MKTSTGKPGTWIEITALVIGNELNDDDIVTAIKLSPKTAKISAKLPNGDEYSFRQPIHHNILIVSI